MAADLNAARLDVPTPRDGEWRATSLATPLGPLVAVAGPRGLVAADIGVDYRAYVAQLEASHDVAIRRDDRGLRGLREDARRYFARRPRALTEPVDLEIARTPFWRDVYAATIEVPFGELRTYGDVAAAAGHPRAWRAAGHALRHCLVELWIPCHRVVPSGPGLGTYGGHPEVRDFLLELEGSHPRRSRGRSAVRTGR